MKKLIILLLITNITFAQNPPKRIKIILLGSFHMNQSLDSNSRLHSNLFTPKRQNEVNELVAKLVKQKPHQNGAVVVVGGPGLEPGTFTLSAGCSNQLS